jgi:Zn-dependent protease
MAPTKVQLILIYIIPVVFAIVLHEVAHGYVAKLRGDHTAALLGRLSVNPIKHIDPLGTIIIPGLMILFSTGFIFGWAKPVPIDYKNLKNPKKDMALIAIAGPFANFLMAIFWGIVAKIAITIYPSYQSAGEIFYIMGYAGVMVNIFLMIINLIPIPPLDGSRVISAFLPPSSAIKYNRLEQWGFLILIALVVIPFNGSSLLFTIITPFIKFFTSIISSILHLNIL